MEGYRMSHILSKFIIPQHEHGGGGWDNNYRLLDINYYYGVV